jgi:AAA ATPase domain
MEARKNPFAPGAGMPPPQLAGRDDIRERASVALDRIRAGRAARSFVFYGLRGVGKTVLLSSIFNQASDDGFVAIMLEAPEGRSLPAVLVPALRTALLRLDRVKRATEGVTRALRALAGFAKLRAG